MDRPLLSKYTSVPPDVIWRYLRKEGISLTGIRCFPTDIHTCTPEKIICEVPLHLELRKEEPMKNISENSKNSNLGNDRMDPEIVARIKGKDGTMIEKTVRIDSSSKANGFSTSTAIDILSYATYLKCEGKDYKLENLLSLSGVYQPKKEIKESKIPVALTTFLKANPEIKTIYLHLDKDKAGR